MYRVERVPFGFAWARWAQVGFWGFIWALIFGALFASFEGPPGFQVAARIGEAVVLGALGWIIVRLARIGIFIDDQQIEFRNVFRTERARWSDVAAFEPPASYGALTKAGLIARLKDGASLSATGVVRGPLEGPSAAQATTDHLNSLLERHRS